MAQFGYCNSNAAYNDVGQSDCGDTYSSLIGTDYCGMMGGMTEYQQGLLSRTPSVCNQQSDYVGVAGMYRATQVPAIATLQYNAPLTVKAPGRPQFLNQAIINAKGQYISPKTAEGFAWLDTTAKGYPTSGFIVKKK